MKHLILFFALLIMLSVMPSYAVMEAHYVIVGHVYQPYDSDIVTIKNDRTQESVDIRLIDCDHNAKEYLFDLANFKQDWVNYESLDVIYGNQTRQIIVDTHYAGVQLDFNRTDIVVPVIIGSILILVAGGYYYIMRKIKDTDVKYNNG